MVAKEKATDSWEGIDNGVRKLFGEDLRVREFCGKIGGSPRTCEEAVVLRRNLLDFGRGMVLDWSISFQLRDKVLVAKTL